MRPFSAALAISIFLSLALAAQTRKPAAARNAITGYQRQLAQEIFAQVEKTVLKRYYDPDYHGVNMKARYAVYSRELAAAPTLGRAFRDIAAYLAGLRDTHTFFIPPAPTWGFFYGFRMRMIGDRAFITAVRPGTDAAKLLRPGDEILGLNGYGVTRGDYPDLTYDIYQLEPQGGLAFKVLDPGGQVRQVTLRTKFVQHSRLIEMETGVFRYQMEGEQLTHLDRSRVRREGNVLIWKLPDFIRSESDLDKAMGQAHGCTGLVLDLRGNPGGEIRLLKYLLGFFVSHKVTVATPKGRHHQDPVEANPHGGHFPGKLVVLVDSGSASASELFARTVQLDHLGTVVGDRSAGAVMEAQFYAYNAGLNDIVPYGVSVTGEDLIMPDGHSLEHTGVTPDVLLVPTAADMAAGRDPVLARAVALAGGSITPAAAGKLFPMIWNPYRLDE